MIMKQLEDTQIKNINNNNQIELPTYHTKPHTTIIHPYIPLYQSPSYYELKPHPCICISIYVSIR